MINFTIDAPEATRLEGLLKALPRQGRMRPRPVPTARPATPQRKWKGLPIRQPAVEEKPGPLAPAVSLFLPAAARRVFTQAAVNLTTHVQVEIPPPRPRHPALVAPTEAARRHSRLTWTEHVERYSLPDSARVVVTYAGPHVLAAVIGGDPIASEHRMAG
jgi:hypothetical protein